MFKKIFKSLKNKLSLTNILQTENENLLINIRENNNIDGTVICYNIFENSEIAKGAIEKHYFCYFANMPVFYGYGLCKNLDLDNLINCKICDNKKCYELINKTKDGIYEDMKIQCPNYKRQFIGKNGESSDGIKEDDKVIYDKITKVIHSKLYNGADALDVKGEACTKG